MILDHKLIQWTTTELAARSKIAPIVVMIRRKRPPLISKSQMALETTHIDSTALNLNNSYPAHQKEYA